MSQGAPTGLAFSVEYARDALDAGRVLQRSLGAHRAEARGCLVCAVQAPQTAARLAASMLPALGEVPCVDVPPHADDSRCGLCLFAA